MDRGPIRIQSRRSHCYGKRWEAHFRSAGREPRRGQVNSQRDVFCWPNGPDFQAAAVFCAETVEAQKHVHLGPPGSTQSVAAMGRPPCPGGCEGRARVAQHGLRHAETISRHLARGERIEVGVGAVSWAACADKSGDNVMQITANGFNTYKTECQHRGPIKNANIPRPRQSFLGVSHGSMHGRSLARAVA
jgi:hypothetical protein